MSYDPIIKIIQQQWETQVEEETLKAIKKYNIDVDKDELIKALAYDREQYEKGYADGLNADKWISVKDRLPEENGRYLCYIVDGNGYQKILYFALNLEAVDDYDFYHQNHAGFYDYDSEYGYFEYTDVTHWMPLPEPPKGE